VLRLSSAYRLLHMPRMAPPKTPIKRLQPLYGFPSPNDPPFDQRRSFKASQDLTKKMFPYLLLTGVFATGLGLGYMAKECPDKKPKTQSISAEAKKLRKITEEISLGEKIDLKVSELIENSNIIPGLTSATFANLKTTIRNDWDYLAKNEVLQVSGQDQQIRPRFVGLQALIEYALASGLNDGTISLVGYIHTPMPATPLCTKGEITKELVADSVRKLCPFTVTTRAMLVRDILANKGELHICYPEKGFNSRTQEQQKIYRQELSNYPQSLFDCPLACDQVPKELIGATYILKDKSGETMVFSINMTQANSPEETGDFGLWFGYLKNNPLIQKRLEDIVKFIDSNKL